MTIEDLIPVWEADMRKIVPEFSLVRSDRMAEAVDKVRNFLIRSKGYRNDLSDLQVCCHVIRSGSENNCGVPAAWWWITASLYILEDIASNPWYEVCWWVYEQSRGKRETNTLWGAANCGKTEFFGAVAWTNMVVWSGQAFVYVTSPWKTHGSDKIWSTLSKRAKRWLANRPEWMDDLKLELKANADEIILTDQDGDEAAARFVSLEGAAAVAGKKRNKTDDLFTINPKQGVMLLISDELLENQEACVQFVEAESNYISNPNVMGFIASNPKPHKVQHSNAISLSAPVERPQETLMRDADYSWRTARGKLVRLCMANSPNAPCGDGEPIFPFLINKAQADAQIRRGEMAQAAQVDAWGWGEGDNGSELTHNDCIREDRQAGPVWVAPPIRVLHADPAFGGQDAASYTCVEFGVGIIGSERKQLISSVEQGVMSVTRRWVPTQQDVDDFKRLTALRGGKPPDDLLVGRENSSSNLVTLLLLRVGARLNIPTGNITYDASQRADVALPMNRALGRVPWYYEGSRRLIDEEGENWNRFPLKRNPDNKVTKWSDEVTRPISMIWRFAERVISRGYVVGLRTCQKGLGELRGRRWVTTGGTGRADVEGKQKLLISPTYGEGIATAIYFAVRFCGALPDLFAQQAESGGIVSLSSDMFQFKSRKLDKRMWS